VAARRGLKQPWSAGRHDNRYSGMGCCRLTLLALGAYCPAPTLAARDEQHHASRSSHGLACSRTGVCAKARKDVEPGRAGLKRLGVNLIWPSDGTTSPGFVLSSPPTFPLAKCSSRVAANPFRFSL
jgi:hypothetical protein